MKCRGELATAIDNDALPVKRIRSFKEVIVKCQGLLGKIMDSLSKPFLLEVAQQVCDKVEATNASSASQPPAAETVVAPAAETVVASAAEPVVASAAETVVQTSPQTPSAKPPHVDKTCVVTIDKLAEEDVEMTDAGRSPAKQSVQSSAATNAVSETVASVSQSSSTARQSTSTPNVESEVEISDDSDTDSFGIDTFASNYWLPSSKWSRKHVLRKPWSDLEEEMVYRGVKAHGVGNWAVIRSNFLRHRSNVDIKDKWRTMIRQGRLEELARRFGPLN